MSDATDTGLGKEELAWTARGDAVRVVSRTGDESTTFYEILGTVQKSTEHTTLSHDGDAVVNDEYVLWIEPSSVMKWTPPTSRESATNTEWMDDDRYGLLSLESGERSRYQLSLQSEEFGNDHLVPLGSVVEFESGSAVTHTAGMTDSDAGDAEDL